MGSNQDPKLNKLVILLTSNVHDDLIRIYIFKQTTPTRFEKCAIFWGLFGTHPTHLEWMG